MTDEQLDLLSSIKQSVEALNSTMEQFENRVFKESEIALAKYTAETRLEDFLPLKWWRQLRTPRVQHPMWQRIDFFGRLEKQLAAPDIDWSELTAELNLCALNAAILAARFNSREVAAEAEQVRKLAERAKAISS
ncbi:hypothetical protein [Hymenobacter sp. B1770]|uniref:hypothetical protein n=1 Tax=Hymenobacter sp. B1770 TaxID=1718788 RepID=UPI003CF21A6D